MLGTPSNNVPTQNSTPDFFRSGAAQGLWFSTGGSWDVVTNYRWTLSRNADLLNEVPYVVLNEYLVDESTIKTQLSYYFTNVTESIQGTNTDKLSPYKDLFPRTPSGNVYRFPYFSDINFQVNTPQWKSLDTLEQGSKFLQSAAGILGGEKAAEAVGGVLEGAANVVGGGLAAVYPKVGIMDRPKLWDSHEFRTIEIKFPLFNTVGPDDWKNNRTLCWLLVNQNLFTKRDLITGIPPVYYEVFIPGQHYSFAACVTNLTIYNRGNMRRMEDINGQNAIVPDVYEVNMTLTDMVMPSRNLFQAIQSQQTRVVVTPATQAGPSTVTVTP